MSGLLFTPRRALADVLDLGAEAGSAMTTLTPPPRWARCCPRVAITLASPDPATADSARPDPPGRGTAAFPTRRTRLRVVPDPTFDPIRCPGGDFPVMSFRGPTPPESLLERGGEAVAGLLLHTAALTLGAVAALGTPVKIAARYLAGPLRLDRAGSAPDPVPDTVRAAARATDYAAGRLERWARLADTPTPTPVPGPAQVPRQRRRPGAGRVLEPIR
ncbi:MAG: hypothetical protein QOE59_1592 [Actinomycetota bacterium]|nr:hypothetical protein [Actinomycetota bacterium]